MPGVVTVRFGVIIDREAFSPPVLELLLLAEDIGLLNGTADLLVTVLDDNDNWPTFSPPTLTVHLLENCPPGKQGPGRTCLLVHGDWSLTGWRQNLPSGRKKGSRAGRESTGEGGSEKPGGPHLPALIHSVCLENEIIKICSNRVPGRKDCFKVKIG